MKSRVLLVIPLLLLCLQSAALAADPKHDSTAIYVVDIQMIITESTAGKAARSDLEAELKKSEARLGQIRLDLEKSQEDFKKQSSLLSEAALAEKQEALLKKRREFERAVADERESLDRKNRQELQQIVVKVDQIVERIARERSISIVVERDPRTILHVDKKFDISQDVLQVLDKEFVDL